MFMLMCEGGLEYPPCPLNMKKPSTTTATTSPPTKNARNGVPPLPPESFAMSLAPTNLPRTKTDFWISGSVAMVLGVSSDLREPDA